MTLRERVFGSRTSTEMTFDAMEDQWRTVPYIVKRAGYHPNTVIYADLLRLEEDGRVESRWLNTAPGRPRCRVYRRTA